MNTTKQDIIEKIKNLNLDGNNFIVPCKGCYSIEIHDNEILNNIITIYNIRMGKNGIAKEFAIPEIGIVNSGYDEHDTIYLEYNPNPSGIGIYVVHNSDKSISEIYYVAYINIYKNTAVNHYDQYSALLSIYDIDIFENIVEWYRNGKVMKKNDFGETDIYKRIQNLDINHEFIAHSCICDSVIRICSDSKKIYSKSKELLDKVISPYYTENGFDIDTITDISLQARHIYDEANKDTDNLSISVNTFNNTLSIFVDDNNGESNLIADIYLYSRLFGEPRSFIEIYKPKLFENLVNGIEKIINL